MPGSVRFAEFALDIDANVLTRRSGERIRLEKVPMGLLVLLVEQAGRLVDRQAIHAALWGTGVFVAQDAAINTAVRKIRLALGDDPAHPRYLETHVGKGYRFIAPIARDVPAEAVAATVRGRHALDKRSEADLREAIHHFQAAIDREPTYAAAYAGLADAYAQLGYGSYVAPEESFARARAAARRAVDLDGKLAEAHAALGFAAMYYDWDFQLAETEFQRAIALSPSSAIAHQWYAYLLTAMERPVEVIEREIAVARRLDPLSVPINIDQAYMLHYHDRNDEALRSVRRALEMNPKFAPAYFWLGRIYTAQGRYDEAELALQNIGPLRTWTPAMAALGYLYAKSGRRDHARAILAEFDDLARQGRYASSYAVAVVYAGLGDREAAMARLEDAVRERSHWLVWLKRDPRWNEIRSDPRFDAFVKAVGLH